MRWRRTFMTEVFESLLRLGLRACPVCGSAESLGMSPFPAILVDGEFPLDSDALPEGEGDLTFAVLIECSTCGHLMLFNAQRYRTGDAKIIEDGITEEERPLPERDQSVRPERSRVVWPQYGAQTTHKDSIRVREAAQPRSDRPGARSSDLTRPITARSPDHAAQLRRMMTRETRRARRLSQDATATGLMIGRTIG